MNSQSIISIRQNTSLSYHSGMAAKLFVLIITGVLFSSCSVFQSTTGADVDRQIELQQIQQDLLAEPEVAETRTLAEYEQLGDSYILRGDANRAYVYYMKGLELQPDNVSLLHKQGGLLLKKNKYAGAEQVYGKLHAIDGNDALALERLGRSYFGQEKYPEAEKAFLAALAISPDLWNAHEYLGLIESHRQNYPQAISRFKAALNKKPGKVSLLNNLAVTYYLNGNNDDAILVSRDMPATKKQKVYNNLALVYFQQGDYEKALASFKKGAESEAMAYNNMGYAYLMVNKYTDAIGALQKAIDLNPKFYPTAQKNLTQAQLELSFAGDIESSKQ